MTPDEYKRARWCVVLIVICLAAIVYFFPMALTVPK